MCVGLAYKVIKRIAFSRNSALTGPKGMVGKSSEYIIYFYNRGSEYELLQTTRLRICGQSDITRSGLALNTHVNMNASISIL